MDIMHFDYICMAFIKAMHTFTILVDFGNNYKYNITIYRIDILTTDI